MKGIWLLSISACFVFFLQTIKAQDAELDALLQGKDRVEDIMSVVEHYYRSKEKNYDEDHFEKDEEEDEFLQWARWGLYMSARTDEQGRLVNVDQRIRSAYDHYQERNFSRTSTGNWTFRGPQNVTGDYGSATGIGRVNRVAFDPVNANTLYIGTPDGGLFKSTNDGTSWTPMTDNIPSISVSGIVVSWADPNDIYILTGDGDGFHGPLETSSGYYRASSGVYVSHDGGNTWANTGDLPANESYAGLNLTQSPGDPDVLLAATTVGLYRTTNGGNSWSLVLSGETFEVKFKPGSSSIVYATQQGEFWRSANGGFIWTEITDFGNYPLLDGRVALAVSENFPAYVYLFDSWAPPSEPKPCGSDPDQTFGGIYLSSDSGLSFARRCNTPNLVESCCEGVNSRNQQYYDLALGASPVNFLNLVSGGILCWRSSNGGQTWSNASGDQCEAESNSTGYVHPDVHDIEYNPLNGNVYLCGDGGILKSANNGITWVSLNNGVAASQAYHLGGSQFDIDNMMIGLQDNGVLRRNANTTTWDHAKGGDGFDCVYNWNSATTGYVSSNAALYKFTGNGSAMTNISPADSFFMRVTSSIANPDIVFVGTGDIFKSVDAGNVWFNKGASGSWDIERCPSNQSRYYAAGGQSAFSTSGSMYFSSDNGEIWTLISNNPGYPTGPSIRLTDIDVRPTNSSNVWITFGGFSGPNKVFYSSNAGLTWQNMTGSLPNVPVNAIKVDANNNVYIGTDIGVFYRADGMSDWVPFWNHLPRIPVTDLELYEDEGIIRASTFGRGVWESDTHTACQASMSLTGNLSGNRFFEASNTINSSSTITGGSNTKVIFKSGGSITLTSGFEAKKYNTVHAYLQACGIGDNGD
ncbi:MAG TPA: hypothetical protein VFV79_00690 [Saprospiraceae bacterium]|nr:hypothetical protein [Saprospiraceae bacterium]